MTTATTSASTEVTTLLRSAKLAFPKMRLGQILSDAVEAAQMTMKLDALYYMSDEQLALALRQYMSSTLKQRISANGSYSER